MAAVSSPAAAPAFSSVSEGVATLGHRLAGGPQRAGRAAAASASASWRPTPERSRSTSAARRRVRRSASSAIRRSARTSALSSAARTASGPSSGAWRRRAISHSRALDGLGGALLVAQRAAQRDVGLLAGGVGGGDGLGGAGGSRPSLGLGLGGGLRGGDELVAAVALLEHALGPARRRLGQLAAAAVQ